MSVPVDPALFRSAMARLGAAVNLVTTDGPGGRHGLTASAVCSVTDAPPTLLVCVNRASAANARLKANGVLCVNLLTGRHEGLSRLFGGRDATIDQRFADMALWRELTTGAPALRDASVALDCRVASVAEVGTHSVFFAEVAEVALAERPEALIWFDRAYYALPALPA